MDWSPFNKCTLYDLHKDGWELCLDVSEWTYDVIASGYHVPKFSDKEHSDDYKYRVSMSAPLDMCRDAVRIRCDNIWRTPPTREIEAGSKYKPLLEQLKADADNEGTSLDDFMKALLWQYYVTGVDVVAQMTAALDGQEIKTLADQKAAGLRPYFLQFSPVERYDWASKSGGGFLWARYCLGVEPRESERATGAVVTRFLMVSQSGWVIWRVWDELDEDGHTETKVVKESEGATNEGLLGRAPITKAYFDESKKPGQAGIPLSLLTRPAIIALVMLNLKSQADGELLAAVPRYFASGMREDALPDSYGPGTIIKLADKEGSIGVVQGEVGHITEKREWLMLYVGELLRLFKFRGGMAEIAAHSGSGLKLAIERTDLDNELRATAGFLEKTELEMMRQAVVLATGDDIKPENAAKELGYSAKYNDDFVLEPLGEMLDNIKKWVMDCNWVSEEVPSLTKEMVKQLRNALVRDDSSTAVEIDDEIKAAKLEGSVTAEEEEAE